MNDYTYYDDLLKKFWAKLKTPEERLDAVKKHSRELFPEITDERIMDSFGVLRFQMEADLICKNCTGFVGSCPFDGHRPFCYIDKYGGYIQPAADINICKRHVPLKDDNTHANGSRNGKKR